MNQDLRDIEITIEEAEQQVRMASLVRELEETPAFKELILEGYFKDNASRLVMLKADATFQEEDKQRKLDADILGISVLGAYLRTTKIIGDMSLQSLEAHKATLADIRQEAL